MKIAILSQLWPDALQDLQARYDCQVAVNPDPQTKWRVVEDAEIVVLRSPVLLDRTTIQRARSLRLIVRAGMGLDTIDLVAARARGIQTICVPLSSQSVAEHSIGLVLSLYRNIPWLHHSLKHGRWEKHHRYGRQLAGQTLGLLGFGRIGICTARIAKAFQMPLLACDRSPEKPAKQAAAAELGVKFVSMEDLFTHADVVTVQIPLEGDSQPLISRDLIDRMKADAVLVNVARGRLVDESALYEALLARRLWGAASDVFASEPPTGNPLLTMENFVGTPHVGAQTIEAQRKVGADVTKLIDTFAMGKEIEPH